MNDATTTIDALKQQAERFVVERDWAQFHSIKNLAMNLSVEAAELAEILMWARDSELAHQLEENRDLIEHEIADIFLAILNFCNRANIDLAHAFDKKLAITAERYPVDKARGSAKKYTKL